MVVGESVASVVGATVVGSVAGVVVSGAVVGVVVSGVAGSGGGVDAPRSGVVVDDGSGAVSAHATANGVTMTASTMVKMIAGNETRTRCCRLTLASLLGPLPSRDLPTREP